MEEENITIEPEVEINSEERLKQINQERKGLMQRVKGDREKRLEAEKAMRITRDEKLDNIREKLNLINKAIFAYKKLGKIDKDKCDIFQTIKIIIDTEETI